MLQWDAATLITLILFTQTFMILVSLIFHVEIFNVFQRVYFFICCFKACFQCEKLFHKFNSIYVRYYFTTSTRVCKSVELTTEVLFVFIRHIKTI